MYPKRLGKQNRKNRGIALIFVLGAIMVISVIAIEMTQEVQIAKMSVVQRRDGLKALELAKAGFRWSVFRLQLDAVIDTAPAIPGTNYGGKKDDFSEVQWMFPLTYPFPTVNAAGSIAEEEPSLIGDGTFGSVITDESAKINLNDVGSSTIQSGTRWSGAASVLVNLLASPRFAAFFNARSNDTILSVPRALDDWTDSDTQVNYLRGGDEETEYRVEGDQADRYKIKNAPLFTLNELKLLKPIDAKLFEELKPFVTVYPFNAALPRVSTQTITAAGKININTAPVEIIAALFSQAALPSNRARLECAQNFAKARIVTAFRSVKPGAAEPNFFSFLTRSCGATQETQGTKSFIEPQVLDILDVRSDLFRIEANGMVGDVEKKIEAVVLRSSDPPKVLYWKVY